MRPSFVAEKFNHLLFHYNYQTIQSKGFFRIFLKYFSDHIVCKIKTRLHMLQTG